MNGLSVLLRHPHIASRSCESCQQWQYDEHGEIAQRGGKPIKRIGPTPCHTCPKKSPAQASQYELSEKNRQAVALYYTTRAMHGTNLSDNQRRDAIVQHNHALIDRIVRAIEAEQANSPMTTVLALATRTAR